MAQQTNTPARAQLDEILDLIAEELQITATQHADAESKYVAVGAWLGKADSPLASFDPSIYAQGSLRIGTTVKPIHKQEFDLDLVCELQQLRGVNFTPSQVYELIWLRMKSNATYREIVKALPRCIRLNYANNFHLDIVPAIPDGVLSTGATRIPDRDLKVWLPSNPKGYARWFEAKTVVRLRKVALDARIEPLHVQELSLIHISEPTRPY